MIVEPCAVCRSLMRAAIHNCPLSSTKPNVASTSQGSHRVFVLVRWPIMRTARNLAFCRLIRKQAFERGIDKLSVRWVLSRIVDPMPPDGREREQFRVRHEGHVTPAVLHGKVRVVRAWHHEGTRLDRTERRGQIATINWVVADVGVLPGPQHGQQVVRVAAQEARLPVAHDEVLE